MTCSTTRGRVRIGNRPALNEGGLADPAHAGDHQEGVPGRGAPPQRVEQLGHHPGASAIDQRVLEVEGLEPAERRAFPLPARGLDHLGVLEPLANPVPHVDFEQLLELHGLLEVVERGFEGAVGDCGTTCRRTG